LSFKILISVTITFFLYYSKETKSRYYSSFWVEGIPVFWWLLFTLLKS